LPDQDSQIHKESKLKAVSRAPLQFLEVAKGEQELKDCKKEKIAMEDDK
jgi:hypothetical protein